MGAVLVRGPGPGGSGAVGHKLTHQVVHDRERRASLGWDVSLLLLQLLVPCPELVPVLLADQDKFAVSTLARAPWRKVNLYKWIFNCLARHAFFLAFYFPILPQRGSVE